mmetsp:Transcript_15059/g.31002  ORF Transcript_15059/g.31002 Transcript_15059/m.31002 type:complete len:244 (+) Transcript_15059:549-1280(+)
MGIHGVLEKEDATDLSADHQRDELGVSPERPGGAGGSEDDRSGGFVLEDLLEHRHGAVGSGETEFLENVLVGDDELPHGLFHSVVGDQRQTAHVRGREGRVEILVDDFRFFLEGHGRRVGFSVFLFQQHVEVDSGAGVQIEAVVAVVAPVGLPGRLVDEGGVLDTENVAEWIDVASHALEQHGAVPTCFSHHLLEDPAVVEAVVEVAGRFEGVSQGKGSRQRRKTVDVCVGGRMFVLLVIAKV